MTRFVAFASCGDWKNVSLNVLNDLANATHHLAAGDGFKVIAPERRLGAWGWFGMEYKFYECDKCGNELRLSLELKGASKDKSETGRPIKTQLDDMQWRVEVFEAEVRSVLGELDHLADVWGDEGVFRRCRDRLRKVLEQCK